jgi:phosphatidylglycerophosphate synthase
MLVAKQVADLLTYSRGMMAFILAGLGLLAGPEALPLVACLMITDWCFDSLDGPIARRSKIYYHTWIGDHDLQIDMTVSVGLLIFLLGAGYVSWWIGVIYVLVWALIFIRFGVTPAPGMLFQAPTYFWFIWITLKDAPGFGALIIIFILTALLISWPKFPKVIVPGFLDGMRKAFLPLHKHK